MTEAYIKTRKTYLDVLRIIAILFVVYIHTGSNGSVYYMHAQESIFYPGYLFISIFVKIAVPLFFMISGVLLIPKEEAYKDVIKRFIRFALILFGTSIIMYFYVGWKNKSTYYSIKDFLTLVYSKGIIVPYWYLYAYLAYILMLPFIRKIARDLGQKDFWWLMALYCLNTLLHIVDYTVFKGRFFHNSNFTLFIGLQYVFYPILGYYLDAKVDLKKYDWKRLLIMGLSCFMIIALMALLTHWRCVKLNQWSEDDLPFFNCCAFVPAITVFITVKKLFVKHPVGEKTQRVLKAIAGTTFGVYLFERVFRSELRFVLEAMKTVIHPYVACWLWVLIVCIVGGGVIFLIRLIPGVKRVI